MFKIDENDKAILRLLQSGNMCKPNLSLMAKKLNMSVTTLHSRIRRLERNQVITEYQTTVDSSAIGKGLTMFVLLKVSYPIRWRSKKQVEDFGEVLANLGDEVQEVHTMSGDWDYLLKIKVADIGAYYDFCTKRILPLEGVEKAHSLTAYKTFKEKLVVNPD